MRELVSEGVLYLAVEKAFGVFVQPKISARAECACYVRGFYYSIIIIIIITIIIIFMCVCVSENSHIRVCMRACAREKWREDLYINDKIFSFHMHAYVCSHAHSGPV